MNKVIISVLGQDRPGIIAAVSDLIFRQDGNIENVSQTILQSEFSAIFIVSLPRSLSLEQLRAALQAGLEPLGQHIHVKPVLPGTPAYVPAPDREPFVITTRGPDRKGLVARITAVIARYGINVTNLQAVFKGGDAPGDNVMIYEVDIPADVDQKRLRRDLRAEADALDLELSIQHRHIFEALNRI
ncbi:MAG TPA: ACT domain-containing protein [Desulfobacteraceae bacterium]|nr:ACT domain-containing protein [Deltaproteobacteria bacterium]MBW2355783.1 ACT domain-containing protein [Deltaproteobacteria bacterium]HDI59715.1 ACT domain-containing protein [Desulfobacteraceae bacterium]